MSNFKEDTFDDDWDDEEPICPCQHLVGKGCICIDECDRPCEDRVAL